MQYFKARQEKKPHERKFFVPVDLDDMDEDDGDAGVISYEDEEAERRRDMWRVAEGLMDFLGVVAGAVVILMLVTVLISLLNWVYADLMQTFNLWQPRI